MSSSSEEEEENYSEDEEEEEEEETHKRKRSKRNKFDAKFFLDDKAQVEEDEEEEEEEEGEEGFVEPIGEEDTSLTTYRRMEVPREATEEEMVKRLTERHRFYEMGEELEDEEPGRIRQQSVLPTIKDSKLWMAKCKIGKEKGTVISLLQKCLDKENTEDKLLIKSVVAPEHLKGYIYIEAEKESHVTNAIKGMRNLQQFQLKLVPIKEMTDVLAVSRKNVNLKKGDWVRVKRGVHRGDLAQVFDLDESRGKITVKLIPRLDGTRAVLDDKGKRKKNQLRPPARFFNPEEIGQREAIDRKLDPNTKEPYYIYGGNKYKDGYLLKSMNVKSLETLNVIPTLDEIQKFQGRVDEDGVIEFAPPQTKQKAFAKGDTVRVVEGDLKNLMGVVDSIEEGTVNIIPKHEDLTDILAIPASQLQKYFKMGDLVKVISGKYEGETGLIVRVENNSVIVFSDLTKKEVKVLSQDIQECTDVTSGKVQLGAYELHDLIQTNPQNVGVIVKIERDSFKVLDNNGNIQTVTVGEIGNKRNDKGAESFDAHQNSITIGDVVKVTDGHFRGRQGTIKHLFKYFLFLHSRDMMENSGIFVVRSSNCALLGGIRRPGGMGQSPRNPMASPGAWNVLRSPSRNFSNRSFPAPMSRRQNDMLLNKTVTIKVGQWKGYVGIVRSVTDTTCRIELHTNSKLVTVNRDMVFLKEEDYSHQEFPPQTPSNWGMQTPMREDGSQTPLRAPPTPLRYGMGTPATPTHGTAWDPLQPNTPRHSWGTEDIPSYTPDYSINTPGFHPSSSFAFSPGPPRSSFMEQSPATEMNPATPTGTYTPGGYESNYTPSYSESTPQDSPMGYQPATPSTPGEATPQTPGTPAESYGSTHDDGTETDADWYTVDIQVRITTDSRIGVIRQVSSGTCTVALESGEVKDFPKHQLEPVTPTQKGNVLIIRGDLKGNSGVLLGIDGADGIVKMSSNLDIKILDLHHLAVYASA